MTDTTPLGLTYPEAGDHTRLWEHFQTLAEDVDTLLSPDRVMLVRSGVNISSLASTVVGAGWTGAPGYQPGDTFTYSAGTITINRSMLALHVVYAGWEANSSGVRRLDVRAGTNVNRTTTDAEPGGGVTGQQTTLLNVIGPGDTCEVSVYQNSGSTLSTSFTWAIVPLVLLP